MPIYIKVCMLFLIVCLFYVCPCIGVSVILLSYPFIYLSVCLPIRISINRYYCLSVISSNSLSVGLFFSCMVYVFSSIFLVLFFFHSVFLFGLPFWHGEVLYGYVWHCPSNNPGPKLKLFKIRFRLNEDKMQNKKRFLTEKQFEIPLALAIIYPTPCY